MRLMYLIVLATALATLVPVVSAQSGEPVTIKQLMLDRIHPAANDILLVAFRGAPDKDKDWASIERSAKLLEDSAKSLTSMNNDAEWAKAGKLLSTSAAEAYKAAQAKDGKMLAGIALHIDASCTDCHKRFRPNVFPGEGARQ
jgi:hypothetical protein